MKNGRIYGIIAALSVGCVTVDEKKMHCYRFDSCLDDVVVSARGVQVDYKDDADGFPKSVIITDKITDNCYRMVRSQGKQELRLERIARLNTYPLNNEECK